MEIEVKKPTTRLPFVRIAGLFGVAWLGVFLLELALAGRPLAIDEPLGWRWLRALVLHPLRSPIALALLGLGVLPAGRS